MNEQKFDDAGRSGRFNPGRIGRSLRPVIGRNAAWMVLVIGTITSLATLLFFLSAAQTNLRERFNNEVNQIQNLLQRRLIAHGEKDDGIVCGSLFEFKIQQAFI